jgi:hypothetical protein
MIAGIDVVDFAGDARRRVGGMKSMGCFLSAAARMA